MEGFVARPGWSTWKVVSEAQTRKEKRNQNKKNNEKMRKRREEWEKTNKDDNGGDDKDDNGEKEEEKNNDTAEIDDEKQRAEKPLQRKWDSKPPSWDEETLRKRLEERGMMVYESLDDIGHHKHIKRTMFPPTQEEIEQFHLEKCMRCLPHDMNTGGFFIALFKKNKPLGERARRKAIELEERNEKKAANMEEENDDEEESHEVLKKKKLNNGNAEEIGRENAKEESAEEGKQSNEENKPEIEGVNKKKKPERNYEKVSNESFIEVDKSVLDEMIEFYGMSDTFARNQLMARGTGQSKLLYYISSSVKKNVFDRGVHNRVKAIHSGLRAFERRSRGAEAEDMG